MTNLKSGLSGCKIELLNDDVLRKYSSGEEYDERLRLQIKKQSLFSHFVLKNIDIPRVIHVNEYRIKRDLSQDDIFLLSDDNISRNKNYLIDII